MSRLIDADALEKDGWTMNRIVWVDKNTMSYQTKKPTDFPIIEPEQKWIPCSERLPEESGNYLVTAMWKGRPEVDMDYWQFDCMWDDWGDEVIAWMPRPEPYKGEE